MVAVIGSTVFLFDGFVESLGIYISDFFEISTYRNQYGDDGKWFKGWSMFYWVWWISWSPFVGTFIARISKGRTLKEIAIYGLLIPSLFSMLWMSVLGGTALDMQLNGVSDLAQIVTERQFYGLV